MTSFQKEMQRAIARFTDALEQDKLEKWKKEENALAKPEERAVREILNDIQFKGIVTRGIGKGFAERVFIDKKDLSRFLLLYNLHPTKFENTVRSRLIAIMKKGYRWESSESKVLRKEYMNKAKALFNLIALLPAETAVSFDGEAIVLKGPEILNKRFKYLDFSSAAAIVDKKPRKKKQEGSGDSVFFQEVYINGKRGVVFGVFDGIDENGFDAQISAMAMDIFIGVIERIKTAKDMDSIADILVDCAQQIDCQISDNFPSLAGVAVSTGVVLGKKLLYLNIGDCRIYALSQQAKSAKKLTVDDGVESMLQRKKVSIHDFYRESHYPYCYLGAFSQRMKGRKSERIVHQQLRFRYPNIGAVDVSSSDALLITTDGAWKQFPLQVGHDNMVIDASGETFLNELLMESDPKDVGELVQKLYNYSRNNMKEAWIQRRENSVRRGVPDDIAILAFNI